MPVRPGQRWNVSGVLPAHHLSAAGLRSAGPAAPGPYVVHATRPGGQVVLRRPELRPKRNGQGVDYVFTAARSLYRAGRLESQGNQVVADDWHTSRHAGCGSPAGNNEPNSPPSPAASAPGQRPTTSSVRAQRDQRRTLRRRRLAERIAIHVEHGRTALAHRLVERARFAECVGRLKNGTAPETVQLAGVRLDQEVREVLAAAGIFTLADLLRQRPARVADLPGMPEAGMREIYNMLKRAGYRAGPIPANHGNDGNDGTTDADSAVAARTEPGSNTGDASGRGL